MNDGGSFKAWAVVEIFGHRRLAGLVSEEVLFGVPMCRIDVPTGDGFTTAYHGGASIYGMYPCDEAEARQVAEYSPVPRFGTGPLITFGYYHEGAIQLDDVDPADYVDPSEDDTADPMARTMPRLAALAAEDAGYININSPEGIDALNEAARKLRRGIEPVEPSTEEAEAYVRAVALSYDALRSDTRPVFEGPGPLTEAQNNLLEAWDSAHGGV